MKVRKEVSGLHLFDRISGLHVLMDELTIPVDDIVNTPRTISIALTNRCDLHCHFCYAPKNKHTLDFGSLTSLCTELDRRGVLEVTFGGGEPTLFPRFEELCNWIWDNTELGISFTTHGHHLTEEFIDKIENKISSIRFSVDGVEPRYSLIRGRRLDELISKIKIVSGRIPFGINCVVSKGQTSEAIKVIELAIELKASNVLIIPEHLNGIFQINDEDWQHLDQIISKYSKQIELLVTFEAGNYLQSNTLEVSLSEEFLFAHVSADNKLKLNSFDEDGILIEDMTNLTDYFQTIRPN